MGELAKIETFRMQLAVAETFEEFKLLGDAAAAYQELMRKQSVSKEKQNDIGEFIVKVEEKKGAWLATFYPSRVNKEDRKSAGSQELPAEMPATKKESARARKISTTPPKKKAELIKKIKDEDKVVTVLELYKEIRKDESVGKREETKKRLANSPELKTDKKYRIIYADPPWMYDKGKELSDHYGDVNKHYPPMDVEAICNLPVKKLTENDCVLFLWATAPKLPESLRVLEAWGFQYKTCIVWDKVKHNFGYYFSVRHELLLIGGIGSSTPDVKELHDSVITIERSNKHSEKPIYFRELIDKLYTTGSRIELFARGELPNSWEGWGNE